MRRLNLEMTIQESIAALSDGNPGALTAMIEMLRENIVRGGGAIAILDELGIYGPDIWILYKDKCGMDARKMIDHLFGGEVEP